MSGEKFDVVVVGAGAAGMMCAAQAGYRGRSVLIIDHAEKPGEKIRISGGGRCNFTNLNSGPQAFLSANPHFCRSALSRYTARDFIALVDRYRIAWHEKTLGQLFCDGSAREIIDMLLAELRKAGVKIRLGAAVDTVEAVNGGYRLTIGHATIDTTSLVIATGGKSIPKMGATGFGYEMARQFGLAITDTRPALVPMTFDPHMLERMAPLTGVAVEDAIVTTQDGTAFREAVLFTHRGISGPAILQASSYWREGQEVTLTLAPDFDVFSKLKEEKARKGRQAVHNILGAFLPNRLAQMVAERAGAAANIADTTDKVFKAIDTAVNAWKIKPVGSEGYRTAEVTLGGVDTKGLDQKTMEAKAVPGLYFIGEVVDVTGWLGGYNFQWAWSSGWVAGQAA